MKGRFRGGLNAVKCRLNTVLECRFEYRVECGLNTVLDAGGLCDA